MPKITEEDTLIVRIERAHLYILISDRQLIQFATLRNYRWIQPIAYCKICNDFPAFWLSIFFTAWDKKQYEMIHSEVQYNLQPIVVSCTSFRFAKILFTNFFSLQFYFHPSAFRLQLQSILKCRIPLKISFTEYNRSKEVVWKNIRYSTFYGIPINGSVVWPN